MVLRQYLQTEPVVAASYLLGCAGKGIAAVVDPVAPVARYLDDADAFGVKIRYVIDTHLHADHESAARELAETTGAQYVLSSAANVSYDHLAVDDGAVLTIGNVAMTVLHTPGHTPEHISLVVADHTRSAEPWAVLTGHTLMVGDMGRTELATNAEEGARALFDSAQRLKELPDHVEVLPGAFAGSVCGRGLSGKPTSTVGFERRFNRAFRIADEAEFITLMTAEIPPPPARAAEIRALNRGAVEIPA